MVSGTGRQALPHQAVQITARRQSNQHLSLQSVWRIARFFGPRLPPVLVVLNSTSSWQLRELEPLFQAVARVSGLRDGSAASGTLLRSQLCCGGLEARSWEDPRPLFWKPEQSQPWQLVFQKDEALLLLCTAMRTHRKIVCPLPRGATRGSLTSWGLKGDSVIYPPLTLTSEAAENASIWASGNKTASVFLLQGPLPCPFYCLRSCSNPGSFTYDQLLLCWSQAEVKTNRPRFPDTTAVLVDTQSSNLFLQSLWALPLPLPPPLAVSPQPLPWGCSSITCFLLLTLVGNSWSKISVWSKNLPGVQLTGHRQEMLCSGSDLMHNTSF